MALEVTIEKQIGTLSLSVDFVAGERPFGLLGASGCGKSTTLKCIAGLLTPDRGVIKLNGRTLFDDARGINVPVQERRVGYLFQNYALFPNMTVRGNIEIGMSKGENPQVIDVYLERFQLKEVEHLYPTELSGGQQQRVALARMMANRPEVLLLDEPFSALDLQLKWHLQESLLEVLEDYPQPVILVSHDKEDVYRFCQEIAVIDQGRSGHQRTKHALFQSPNSCAEARLLGIHNILTYEEAITLSLKIKATTPQTHVAFFAKDIVIQTEATGNTLNCRVQRFFETEEGWHLMVLPHKGKRTIEVFVSREMMRMPTKDQDILIEIPTEKVHYLSN